MKTTLNPFENAKRTAQGTGGGTLPTATSEKLGGVKIGEGVNVSEDGTISVPTYTPPAYSTNEVATGKAWIDGKMVYRKVIVLESKVWIGTSLTTITNDIGIDTVVSSFAIFNDGTGRRCNPIHIIVNNGYINGRCEAGEFECKTLIVEYTKTGA